MRGSHLLAMIAALTASSLSGEQGQDDLSKARARAESDQMYKKGRMAYAQGLARARHMLDLDAKKDLPRVRLLLAASGVATRMPGPSADDVALLGMTAIGEMLSFAAKMLSLWPTGVKRPECAPGCAFCCRQRIACSIPEAAAIAKALKDEDAVAKNPEIHKDWDAPPVALEAWIGSLRVVVDVTAAMQDAGDWARAGVRCAFLLNYRCGIYQCRPLTCIGHTSVSKADCRRAVGDATAQIPSPVTPKLEVATYQVGIVDALRRAGYLPMAVDMHQAVLLCLQDETAVDRWLQGESVFDAMALPIAGMGTTEDLDAIHEDSEIEIEQAMVRVRGAPV